MKIEIENNEIGFLLRMCELTEYILRNSSDRSFIGVTEKNKFLPYIPILDHKGYIDLINNIISQTESKQNEN